MPLMQGSSQQVISRNIAELHHSAKHRSNAAIVAIAMSMAHKKKKMPQMPHK